MFWNHIRQDLCGELLSGTRYTNTFATILKIYLSFGHSNIMIKYILYLFFLHFIFNYVKYNLFITLFVLFMAGGLILCGTLMGR